MVVIEFSNHLRDMLSQRNISELWVRRTVELRIFSPVGAKCR